jgi:hypothetical protein
MGKIDLLEAKRRLRNVHGDTISLVDDSYIGFKKRAIFVHKDLGKWAALPYVVITRGSSHTQNRTGRPKTPISTIKENIYKIHGNTITIDEPTYVGRNKKATFIHESFGSWVALVGNVLSGSTHPQVALDNRRTPLSKVKQRLSEIHGESVKIVENTYMGTKQKATFVHEKYGSWEATVGHLLWTGSNHMMAAADNLKLTQQEVEEKLKTVHGDSMLIVWSTFVNSKTKATFIHKKYGEFSATPNFVFNGGGPAVGSLDKLRTTNMKRYGVEHSSQNREIALKTAKSSNKTTILFHWKTGEELVCQASYEPKVVNYLNFNKINYLWQPTVFKMSNGKTYRPDFYNEDDSKWVEIKGYFRKDALDKWNWFISEYPNSELWDEKKLKSLGIL